MLDSLQANNVSWICCGTFNLDKIYKQSCITVITQFANLFMLMWSIQNLQQKFEFSKGITGNSQTDDEMRIHYWAKNWAEVIW